VSFLLFLQITVFQQTPSLIVAIVEKFAVDLVMVVRVLIYHAPIVKLEFAFHFHFHGEGCIHAYFVIYLLVVNLKVFI
jgi:hypothetical protein